jgi:hypothetical protein
VAPIFWKAEYSCNLEPVIYTKFNSSNLLAIEVLKMYSQLLEFGK